MGDESNTEEVKVNIDVPFVKTIEANVVARRAVKEYGEDPSDEQLEQMANKIAKEQLGLGTILAVFVFVLFIIMVAMLPQMGQAFVVGLVLSPILYLIIKHFRG